MNLHEKLNTYIDYMFREVKVKNSDLCRLKICRQILFPENSVSVITREDKKTVGSMLRILSILHSTYDAVIIIENNDRALLAEIMQQFVYIEYNVSRLVIKLRNEVKEEKNSNIKIAVAASKKTGKSVLANCMLGMELAPTSLELATPNTCVYRKSRDGKFRVIVGSQSNEFADKDSILNVLAGLEREAKFLHRQLGYPKVSLEMIRRFSGIPKLLDYVEAVVKRSFF